MALGHWLKDYIGPHSGGSGGGGTEPLIVRLNVDTLDKTWQEIYDAFPNVIFDNNIAEAGIFQKKLISLVSGDGNEYFVGVGSDTYVTYNSDGYPDNGED